MKKIISVLTCLFILMTAFCAVASAESAGNTYTFENGDTRYTVEFPDGDLAEEKELLIAERLVYGSDDSASAYGLGCTLFGHDYLYKTVFVVEHKVSASAPRCKRNVYDVKYCEDCDFTEETLKAYEYIYCCD